MSSAHRQEFGPFTFDAPSAWTRRPVLVMGDPESAKQVVIGRDQRNDGEQLAALAWRRLYEIRRADPSRRLVDARATEIAGSPAFRAVLERSGPGAPTRETMAWVDAGDGAVLVASSTTTPDDSGQVFEEMLASMRLSAVASPRATPAPSRPPPPRTPPPGRDDDIEAFDAFPMPQARTVRR